MSVSSRMAKLERELARARSGDARDSGHDIIVVCDTESEKRGLASEEEVRAQGERAIVVRVAGIDLNEI